ncbi:MAG: glycosyltransferase 87 family protein [Ignavibacteriaceae bacterium]
MKQSLNILGKYFSAKTLWILLGVGVIHYAIYIFFVSGSLTYDAQPDNTKKILFVVQRILIGLLFFIAIININKVPIKETWIAWIIFSGLLARVVLIPSSPILEDDFYRYLWDGTVTANGFNPYVQSPQDVLDKNINVPDKILDLAKESGEVINKINHPKIKTLYPALSQLTFAVSYIIFPWSVVGWKFVMLIGDILLLFFLIRILKELKLPIVFISIYWLNPIVLHEFFNTGHYDLFALLFTAISIYYFLKNKYLTSSVMLALAVGFKLWPVLIFPIFLRRLTNQKGKLILNGIVFSLVVIIIFIPVLLAGYDENQGFMKYAANWINNAAFYTLLKDGIELFTTTFKIYYVCADCVARWIVGGIVFITLLFLIRKPAKNNLDITDKILMIIAISFLISPTQFPWYITWMILPLVFSPKVSLLMYAFLIPLYHLNPLSGYFIYIQHIPVILLFIYEIKKGAGFGYFNRSQLLNEN